MAERYYGLDVIRLVSFFAIATFHVSLVHYGTPAIDIASQSIVIRIAEQISRVLSFSGFTILFLTSMLTAYSGASRGARARLFSFLIAGWVVFSLLMHDDHALVWDIYPLVLFGVLTASLGELAGRRVVPALGLLGFMLLWVPFWDFREMIRLPPDAMLVLGFGDCQAGDRVEWPVLPWMGLIWFGYWCGQTMRSTSREARESWLRLTKKEVAVWLGAFALSAPQLGSFYRINLGEFFACEAYRQPPLVWWSHFVWPLAVIRLALAPEVQVRLRSLRLCRAISGLEISRRFWLAYITNYLFAHVINFVLNQSRVEDTAWNAPVIALIAVFFVPVTELLTRGVVIFSRFFRRHLLTREGDLATIVVTEPAAK